MKSSGYANISSVKTDKKVKTEALWMVIRMCVCDYVVIIHTHKNVYSDPRICVDKDRIQNLQLDFLTIDTLYYTLKSNINTILKKSEKNIFD